MKNKPPAVSIIIPTFNRAYCLPRAVESVLKQTFPDFELIIVDDGSIDDTGKIISRLQDEDARIKYIKHGTNKGGNAARNTGIKNSKGKYIAFLDSDDEWLPEKLRKKLLVFNKTKKLALGFVYCGAIVSAEGRVRKKLLPEFRGEVLKQLLRHCFVGCGSNNLILKNVFDNCGLFDECEQLRKGGSQEYEMWIRIAKKYQFDCVDECLLIQHIQENSVTSFKENNPHYAAASLIYILEKHKNEYRRYPSAHSYKLKILAKWYFLDKKMGEARKNILKAVKLRPLTPRSYLFLFFTFLPQQCALILIALKNKFLGRTGCRII